MLKCSSCSAPLKKNNPLCVYCGTRNNIDLTSINYFTSNVPDKDRICSICNEVMKTINVSETDDNPFLIERCDKCHSLFFDSGELEALMDEKTNNVFNINYALLNSLVSERSYDVNFSYRKCPICEKIMNRKNYGTKSGIVVDVCKEHGVFLDAGELKHLKEWRKAGGQFLHEQRKAKEKNEKEKLKKKKKLDIENQKYDYNDYSNDRYHKRAYRSDNLISAIVDLFVR